MSSGMWHQGATETNQRSGIALNKSGSAWRRAKRLKKQPEDIHRPCSRQLVSKILRELLQLKNEKGDDNSPLKTGQFLNRYSSRGDTKIATRSYERCPPTAWPVENKQNHSKMSFHLSCLAITENLKICWQYHGGTGHLYTINRKVKYGKWCGLEQNYGASSNTTAGHLLQTIKMRISERPLVAWSFVSRPVLQLLIK